MRYSELRRLLPQLSDKVLSDRLRELEYNGLVVKNASHSARSVTVYGLSERGESLQPMLNEVYRWGAEHASFYGVRCALQPLGVMREVLSSEALAVET